MRKGLIDGERGAYVSYFAMKQRCYDPNFIGFHNYGGRGISVCSRWHSFDNFLADMGPRPEGMSIERKDTDGNYEPDNCKWATASEQSRNTRKKRIIVIDGTPHHVADLSERYGINMRTIAVRYERGYSMDKILSPTLLRGTKNRTKTHCKRGHEFTCENTYVWNGHRECKTCRIVKDRRYKARRAEVTHGL